MKFADKGIGWKSIVLRLPSSSVNPGKLLALGCGICFTLSATAPLINSAFRVEEKLASLSDPGTTMTANSKPHLPLNTIPESVSKPEEVLAVSPEELQVTTDPDIIPESVSQLEGVLAVSREEPQVSTDPNIVPEPVPQPEEVWVVSPAEPQVTTGLDLADSGPLEWTFSEPGPLRTASAPDTTGAWPTREAERSEGGDIVPARYMERLPENDSSLLGLLTRRQANGGILIWSNLQAGYGQPLQDDSVLARGGNGTPREEPGWFYVRTIFHF